MEKNERGKVIKEIILALIFSFLYILLAVGISGGLLLLCPVAFIILSVRNNSYIGLIAGGLFSIILAFMVGFNFGLSIFLIIGPITFTIAYLISEGEDLGKAIFISSIVLIISLTLLATMETRLSGVDIKAQVEEGFSNMLTMQMDTFEDMDLDKYTIKELRQTLTSAYKYMMAVMPTMFIIMSSIMAYLNYKISAYILSRTGERVRVPEFSSFALPENFLMGSAAMFIAVLIIGRLELPYHKALSLNVSILLAFLFLVQGLAILSYLFKRKGMRKAFRLLLIVLIMAILPINGFLMILGFIDSMFDLRKIRGRTS